MGAAESAAHACGPPVPLSTAGLVCPQSSLVVQRHSRSFKAVIPVEALEWINEDNAKAFKARVQRRWSAADGRFVRPHCH